MWSSLFETFFSCFEQKRLLNRYLEFFTMGVFGEVVLYILGACIIIPLHILFMAIMYVRLLLWRRFS